MSFKEPMSLYFNLKQLEIMTKIIELFTKAIFRSHHKMGETHSSSINSAIKQCCNSLLLLCQEAMKLKMRKSPLQQIFRDPSLVYEAQKLISDGNEVDRLIEKTIEAYKMSWNCMKQMDKKGAYLLIYSKKVKKRFVNLLFNDAPRTINLLIQILNRSLIMEFEATQMTS
jgi:hypothetical protein